MPASFIATGSRAPSNQSCRRSRLLGATVVIWLTLSTSVGAVREEIPEDDNWTQKRLRYVPPTTTTRKSSLRGGAKASEPRAEARVSRSAAPVEAAKPAKPPAAPPSSSPRVDEMKTTDAATPSVLMRLEKLERDLESLVKERLASLEKQVRPNYFVPTFNIPTDGLTQL